MPGILTARSVSSFALIAVLYASGPSLFAQTEANAFFDDSKVQTINVTMDPADWATLIANYQQDTYYHATMMWNGQSVTFGIRSHGGGGSRSPIKPNLDFNFAHYTKTQTFLGLPFILMKANNEDPSNLHEWLSMKLYRKMGLPAPREAPAQLSINGQLLGFYFIVEHLDETFLQRNFGENTGYLYEWEYGQGYEFGNLGTDPSSYSAFLDLKTNQSSPDLQTFVNFIQAVNQSPANESSYIGGLAPYINPKLFLTYCATENVLAEEDGVLDGIAGANNFYLYQFNGTTLYQMIAWDKDRTFSDPNRGILDGVTFGATTNVLAQTLYTFADFKAVYLSELDRAALLFGGTGSWADQEIAREYNVIRSAALNDPNKQCDYTGAGPVPCGTQDFESGIEAIHTFIAQRSNNVLNATTSAGYQLITTNPQLKNLQVAAPVSFPEQFSPGALAYVMGANLGSSANATGAPLPRILGQTFVAIDGVRAPLFNTASGQIQIQVPGDLPTGLSTVVVSKAGAMSNPFSIDIWTTTPAIAAITRADGSVAVAGNAPKAGENVSIYAIGLGAVTPDVTIGGAPPAGIIPTTLVTPQITLGSASLNVSFSGLVAGYVGLYQVNTTMPASLPPGSSAQLTLTADGQSVSVSIPLQ